MNKKYLNEVNTIHRVWELTGMLDIATTPGERKMLALILEDRRLRKDGTIGQYERIYRPAIGGLHDEVYHYCVKLSNNISDDMIAKLFK